MAAGLLSGTCQETALLPAAGLHQTRSNGARDAYSNWIGSLSEGRGTCCGLQRVEDLSLLSFHALCSLLCALIKRIEPIPGYKSGRPSPSALSCLAIASVPFQVGPARLPDNVGHEPLRHRVLVAEHGISA